MNTIIPIFIPKASSITVIKKSEWIYMKNIMAKDMTHFYELFLWLIFYSDTIVILFYSDSIGINPKKFP